MNNSRILASMKSLRPIAYFLVVLFFSKQLPGQQVSIARDSFGVPHIFGQTDAEVAYGLGWVQCEDQFKTLQELLAACRGVLGELKGKNGVVADIGIQYMGIADFVKEHYDKEVTGHFRNYLEHYVQAVNDYALEHPERVLLKKLFPVTGQDVITGYLLGNVEISGAGGDLQRILNNNIIKYQRSNFQKGSNAIAISNRKTKDRKTYLAINSHQPLEGWYSWYEAHLHSEEGLNIIGGTFAGGVCIFHGANQHLGWAHTVNHADFSDVYKLTVNKDGNAYLYDNEWLPLRKKKIKAKAKIAGIQVPIKRTMYHSIYGPTIKNKHGFYAWTFSAGTTLKMAEQWFRMNKAKNFGEFKQALEMKGIVSTNIVYADREDNIFYISNGRLPERDSRYEWDEVLPGDTSLTKWGKLIDLDQLPQVLNPKSGYLFNTNNTPFSSSSPSDNPQETPLNEQMGYQESGDENNRSRRFMELMSQYDKITYEDFKAIKYDDQYPEKMEKIRGNNVSHFFNLKPSNHPEIEDALILIQSWNRKTDIENKSASIFLASVYQLDGMRGKKKYRGKNWRQIDRSIEAIRLAQKDLIKHFGRIDIPLGTLQRHSRGDVNLPIAGGPDVLAAMYSGRQKDGTYRALGGESYISLVRFSEEGVELETINAFGNSEYLDDPNSTNQMKFYAERKLKKMTFDKEEILASAVKVYTLKINP